jgi:hypothetical protein
MNRRNFFKRCGICLATVLLPANILARDIIKQPAIKPKISDNIPIGHRGSQYLESGFVCAPYIPLYMNKSGQ